MQELTKAESSEKDPLNGLSIDDAPSKAESPKIFDDGLPLPCRASVKLWNASSMRNDYRSKVKNIVCVGEDASHRSARTDRIASLRSRLEELSNENEARILSAERSRIEAQSRTRARSLANLRSRLETAKQDNDVAKGQLQALTMTKKDAHANHLQILRSQLKAAKQDDEMMKVQMQGQAKAKKDVQA